MNETQENPTITIGNTPKNILEKAASVAQAVEKKQLSPQQLMKTMVDNEFPDITDVFDLPSKGILYPNRQTQVKVKMLTTVEEEILSSSELIKSGKVLDVLLDQVVIDSPTHPDDMLSGDRNAILLFLSKTGVSDEYMVKMTCPECTETFIDTVLLSSLESKPLDIMPDQDGWFSVTLPKINWNIRFRLLTGKDESFLQKKSEQLKKSKQNIAYSKILTERYLIQLMEINGNKDKTYIQRAISHMPYPDSIFLKRYIREVDPGVNMEHMFTCKKCSATFEDQIPVNAKLFWPEAKI